MSIRDIAARLRRTTRSLVELAGRGGPEAEPARAPGGLEAHRPGGRRRSHVRRRGRREVHGMGRRGDRRHPLYVKWSNAVQRVTNPRNDHWPAYGGRGIRMCRAWRRSFRRFAADVGEPPHGDYAHYTIERLNVDRGYYPGNVTWVPAERQPRNKQDTIRVEWDGEQRALRDVVEESGAGLKARTVEARLRRGRTLEEALEPELGGEIYRRSEIVAAEIARRIAAGELFATGDGRVLDLVECRELTVTPNPDGYLMAELPRMGSLGVCGRVGVHRIVALQWLSNPEPTKYLVVHHLDRFRDNPRLDNLVWSTPEANRRGGDEGHAPRRVRNVSPYTEEEALALIEPRRSEGRIGASRPPILTDRSLDDLRELPGFDESIFAAVPEAALGILLAPSNGIEISPNGASTLVFDANGEALRRKDLFAVAPTDRVYFGCPACGYESARPLERRTRIGSKARDVSQRGLDVCCCTSLAVQAPALDALRRSDPVTGEHLNGTEVPARTKGVRAYVRCSRCGADRVRPIDVKTYVTRSRLPLCESCRARGRAQNFGRGHSENPGG